MAGFPDSYVGTVVGTTSEVADEFIDHQVVKIECGRKYRGLTLVATTDANRLARREKLRR